MAGSAGAHLMNGFYMRRPMPCPLWSMPSHALPTPSTDRRSVLSYYVVLICERQGQASQGAYLVAKMQVNKVFPVEATGVTIRGRATLPACHGTWRTLTGPGIAGCLLRYPIASRRSRE